VVYARFAVSLRPECIVMEEVSNVVKMYEGRVLRQVVAILRRGGYLVRHAILEASNYGVPQHRRRLFLMAVRGRGPELEERLQAEFPPAPTVRAPVCSGTVIKLPVEGCVCGRPNGGSGHGDRCRRELKGVVLQKVRSREKMGRAFNPTQFGTQYKLVDLSKPAGTITTQFTGASNGPYTIKSQRSGQRARYFILSINDGQRLMSYPASYRFSGTNTEKRRQIGNSVPPLMARAVGAAVDAVLR
jgi:DNA (cytosine-5)-methyltransferase 1